MLSTRRFKEENTRSVTPRGFFLEPLTYQDDVVPSSQSFGGIYKIQGIQKILAADH